MNRGEAEQISSLRKKRNSPSADSAALLHIREKLNGSLDTNTRILGLSSEKPDKKDRAFRATSDDVLLDTIITSSTLESLTKYISNGISVTIELWVHMMTETFVLTSWLIIRELCSSVIADPIQLTD